MRISMTRFCPSANPSLPSSGRVTARTRSRPREARPQDPDAMNLV